MLLALAWATLTPALAGPLVPPAGPILSTPGPEPRTPINATNAPGDADSTFRIVDAGSYYLTGNISAQAGRHGIEIFAQNVTIDLNGFTIFGNGGGNTIDGIHAANPADANRCTIRNGTINNFPGDGVGLAASLFVTVENVKVVGCGGAGISAGTGARQVGCVAHLCGTGFLLAQTASAESCVASNSTGVGFASLDAQVRLKDCAASQNGQAGYSLGIDATLESCLAANNGVLVGSSGFATGQGAVFRGCVARGNSANGFSPALRSTLVDCRAMGNVLSGFTGGSAMTLEGCTADGNFGDGFNLGTDSHVTRCHAIENTSMGIRIAGQGLVQGCMVNGNRLDGISGGTASVVRDNQVVGNSRHGIDVVSDGLVVGNLCDSNGIGSGITDGSGIRVTGFDTRIDGNTVTDNDRGINVTVGGCFIVRNTASGNTTNYEIVTGNAVGTIVLTPASAAISGSIGGSGVGSTDPWANFSF